MRIESGWIDAFGEVFQAAAIRADERVVILSEARSRAVLVDLADLALGALGVHPFHVVVPSPPAGRMIARSTGASRALTGIPGVVDALKTADVVVDITVEGLMHAPETAAILSSGARIQTILNEHPETLERMRPDPALKEQVREAVRQAKCAHELTVTSPAGSDLAVVMDGAQTVGVWGWTDRPGTLAHWPGGIVVSFPRAHSTRGRLVLQPGDMNLTYKRYLESRVVLTLEDDRVRIVEGEGVDARLMRDTLSGWGDPDAYAVSHVGWGLNRSARWDALTMHGRADTNGAELRAVAGNFLFSTGANEFAGRFTEGHFDLPMMGCTIALDGVAVVDEGQLV